MSDFGPFCRVKTKKLKETQTRKEFKRRDLKCHGKNPRLKLEGIVFLDISISFVLSLLEKISVRNFDCLSCFLLIDRLRAGEFFSKGP